MILFLTILNFIFIADVSIKFYYFYQKMRFSHSIEYKMRIIVPKTIFTKCGGETVSTQFSKKLKLSISLNQ